MTDKPFRTPLFLKLDSYANYCARSPWDALDYLENHWQAPLTDKHRRAVSVCQSAIDGWVGADVAYDAVAAAAREARLLQRGWRPLQAPSSVAA